MEMRERLKLLATKLFPDPFACLDLDKKQLIDFACLELGMRSFADLGAVWNVDAGYTFYAMERHKPSSGAIVDTDVTPTILERQKRCPGLRIIKGNFGQSALVHQSTTRDHFFVEYPGPRRGSVSYRIPSVSSARWSRSNRNAVRAGSGPPILREHLGLTALAREIWI